MAELRRYEHVLYMLLPSLLLHGWSCRLSRDPEEGDLVMLQCAPQSDWTLSIYRGHGAGGHFDKKHHLESLKTGVICDWHNVGFNVIDREKVGIGERWTWTDDQFDFQDKFAKVCSRADFYMAIPYIAGFDGDTVQITFRTRFCFDDKLTQVPPFEWRKITQKSLMEKLIETEQAHKADKAA